MNASNDDVSITLETPEQDPRIGKQAIASDGCTGIIESIMRHPDGSECIQLMNLGTGSGHGGASPETITILD